MFRKTNPIFFIFILLIMTACASHRTSSGRRHAFLKKIEQQALSKPTTLADSTNQPLMMKAGQWVSFFTRAKSGQRMEMVLTTYKVLKIDGNTMTLEIEAETPIDDQRTVITYQIEHFPRPDVLAPTKGDMDKKVQQMNFKQVLLKIGDGEAKLMPPEVLKKAGTITQKALARFYRLGDVKADQCASSYLQANVCHLYNYEGEVAGKSGKGIVWGHSDVPIVHFIQAEDDKTITQVINFGHEVK